MSRKLNGIKKQVFGAMILLSGLTVNAWDMMTGNKLEVFYVALVIAGCLLFIYGAIQNRQK